MAILPIFEEGSPILRRKAVAIPKVTRKLRLLAKDMLNTMYQADGVGLAAPQVGVSERLVVIDVGDSPLALINPVIKEASGEETDLEGCLSIPTKVGYVSRASDVLVWALGLDGKPQEIRGSGFLARALQHEIDHLDGVLFTDRATSIKAKPKGGASEE